MPAAPRWTRRMERERILGHPLPATLKLGAMLETPSLAFAPDQFFADVDFLSIGGNDLKQFFFAADRENERVRRRYDTLNVSFLTFLQGIVERCMRHRHAAQLLRRGCGPAGRGGLPCRHRLAHAVDAPGLDRAGQVDPAPDRSGRIAQRDRRRRGARRPVGAPGGDGISARKALGHQPFRTGVSTRLRSSSRRSAWLMSASIAKPAQPEMHMRHLLIIAGEGIVRRRPRRRAQHRHRLCRQLLPQHHARRGATLAISACIAFPVMATRVVRNARSAPSS